MPQKTSAGTVVARRAKLQIIQVGLALSAISILAAVFAATATLLHSIFAVATASYIGFICYKLNYGRALIGSRISAHNKLPGYNDMADLPVTPTTIAIFVRNPEGIIEKAGLKPYLSAIGDLGLMIQDRVESKVFHVDGGTLVYQSERGQCEEVEVVRKLLEQTSSLFIDGDEIDLFLHAGICLSEGLDMEQSVIKAMIAAKEAASDRKPFVLWGDNPAKSPFTLSIITEFERAIALGHVWLAYQPKHDVRTRAISGAEALIRWNHPEHGQISPDRFIPLLEAAGRMEALTEFTINQAIRDFAVADADLDIAVNIAPSMLGSGLVLDMVKRTLERYHFPASRFVIEITETDVVHEAQIDEIQMLRNLGIEVAIDDYGAGYSTVSHLKRLPATQIKLDKSLIAQVLADDKDKLIIASSIRLAHEMGMKVVAEGAEIEAQCEFLHNVGCDMVQGFILGKPMPITEFQSSLARARRRAAA